MEQALQRCEFSGLRNIRSSPRWMLRRERELILVDAAGWLLARLFPPIAGARRASEAELSRCRKASALAVVTAVLVVG